MAGSSPAISGWACGVHGGRAARIPPTFGSEGLAECAALFRPKFSAFGTGGLLGGGHLRGVALGFQFQEGAAVILRRHLDKGRERVVPILEQRAGAGAAGEQVMPLDQDAQPLRVEAERVAHAVVNNVWRPLARAVVGAGALVGIAIV